jgi:hypothetical protein
MLKSIFRSDFLLTQNREASPPASPGPGSFIDFARSQILRAQENVANREPFYYCNGCMNSIPRNAHRY